MQISLDYFRGVGFSLSNHDKKIAFITIIVFLAAVEMNLCINKSQRKQGPLGSNRDNS